jgi:hypothetical protein
MGELCDCDLDIHNLSPEIELENKLPNIDSKTSCNPVPAIFHPTLSIHSLNAMSPNKKTTLRHLTLPTLEVKGPFTNFDNETLVRQEDSPFRSKPSGLMHPDFFDQRTCSSYF